MSTVLNSRFMAPLGAAFSISCAASVVALSLSALPTPAEAARKRPVQTYSAPPTGGGLFGDVFSAPAAKPYRVYGTPKPRPRPAGQPASKTAKTEPIVEKPIKGPLVITVSLSAQRVTVHDTDGPIAEAPISSGQPAFPTLTGVFSILEKSVVHHSNLYAGAPMPNMQRLTWSGTAMHAGDLPGYPASHGCIRLPYNFSKKLYGMTKLGTRVIVARESLAPVAFSHPKLIAPLPPETEVTTTGALGDKPPQSRETKVAEQIDYESVRSVSYVTAANAAEVPHNAAPAATSVRSAYRAARAAELERLEASLKTVLDAKAGAEARAKRAVAAADAIKADASKAKADADQKVLAIKKTEQAMLNANRSLEAHARKYDGKDTPAGDVMAKVLAEEVKLEETTASLQDALAAAKQDAERSAIVRTAAEANFAVAVKEVKDSAALLAKANADLKIAQGALDEFKRIQALRKNPVSVFISRASKRLYVRQAHKPVFDVPVTFDNPDAPVGTHVFTALELINGDTDMRWSAVSIPTTSLMKADASGKKKKNGKPLEMPVAVGSTASQKADTALDRITIPEEARDRIADVLKPGSSIIVSDYAISHQTGEFTDFIILTR